MRRRTLRQRVLHATLGEFLWRTATFDMNEPDWWVRWKDRYARWMERAT